MACGRFRSSSTWGEPWIGGRCAARAPPDLLENVHDGKVQAAGPLIGAAVTSMGGKADVGCVRELVLERVLDELFIESLPTPRGLHPWPFAESLRVGGPSVEGICLASSHILLIARQDSGGEIGCLY